MEDSEEQKKFVSLLYMRHADRTYFRCSFLIIPNVFKTSFRVTKQPNPMVLYVCAIAAYAAGPRRNCCMFVNRCCRLTKYFG